MRAMLRWLRTVLVTGLLAYSGAAKAGLISITPNADPGNLRPGDTLTFTASVDSVAPPSGASWFSLDVGPIRIGGGDDFNFQGCSDLSGLTSIQISCSSAQNGADWMWQARLSEEIISGDLVSFTALFEQPGTYQVFVEGARASFLPNGLEHLTISNGLQNPIFINVAVPVAAVAEPATAVLLALGLAAVRLGARKTALARRRQLLQPISRLAPWLLSGADT